MNSERYPWASWILLAAAAGLQAQAGLALLPADLLSSDPPAHFTTGVMLHDFLKHATQPPLPFAECFYIQYPKVAFGHWPPLLYILEAGWFFVFGVTIVAARWLCACIAAGCAAAVYFRCRPDWGRWQAMAASALFLAYPVVRHQAWNIMSDLLLTGLTFLAVCSLSDYLITERRADALWLVVWSSLAILTKGTGWLLLGPIAAAPLFTGRRRAYRRGSYWLAILATCAISAPFYVVVSRLHLGYPVPAGEYLHRLKVAVAGFSAQGWMAAISILIIAGFAIHWLLPTDPVKRVWSTAVVLGLWMMTLIVFINLVPLTLEMSRYYMVLLAPLAYLVCGGMAILEQKMASGRLVTLLLYAGAMAFFVPLRFVSTPAFSKAIGAVPITEKGAVILVESDSGGEGAMIASRLERDRFRSSYVLRGSQLLATSSWSGWQYASKYGTADGVRSALDAAGAEYVIYDTSAPPTSDGRLLASVLQDPGGQWRILARVPVALAIRPGELLVYRKDAPAPTMTVPTSVQLGPERGSQALTCKAR